jgi:DNA polymerase I
MKKLFLLDGHALVYRAHYAFMTRPLLNSKGWNVSCINGFTRTLWDLLKKEKPTHIAVSFDLSGGTFRNDLFPEYKANRDAQPEDISFGIPYIKKIIEGMNIPIVTAVGYEADDVIGTLAKQAEKEGFEVYMMTPDKDFGQLVSDKVFMYKPAKGGNDVEIWGVKEVCENWGIQRPDQVVDILGLQGDAVDNIPGIPGIGPKTAAVLLAQYDTLEGILENVDKLKGKQQENVRNFAEQGRLSKVLAKIDIEAPVQFSDADYLYHIDQMRKEELAAIFKELEFRTLASEILGEGRWSRNETASESMVDSENQQKDLFGNIIPIKNQQPTTNEQQPAAHSIADKNINNTPHTYHLTDTKELRAELLKQLSSVDWFCFDTETTNIDPNEAELVGMSFATKAHEAYYVPVPKEAKQAQEIVEEFRAVLENEAIKKIGQNLKYDLIIFKWCGIEVKGAAFDTMLAHYLMEPELRHGMNYMSETYLKYQPVSIETLIGKGKNQLSMRDIAVEKVVDYAAEDADVTYQLFEDFQPKMKIGDLETLFQDLEMPLMQVLVDLEYEGIKIDATYLENYAKELDILIREKEKEVYEKAGVRFNIASPKQVGDVLFDRLKIPYRWKKTGKTDQYSTDEDKLAELAFEFPIARTILDYRSLAKLQGTYVEALPRMINKKTGRGA